MSKLDFHDWLIEAMLRWTIRFDPVIKRTEENGVRGFYLRYTWTASRANCSESESVQLRSDWEGFNTAEECLADIWQKISEQENKHG